MCKGDRVGRRRSQEVGVVAPRGNRETTSGYPGRFAGSWGGGEGVGVEMGIQ